MTRSCLRNAIVAVATALVFTPSAWAQFSLQPGLYEMTLEMAMPGAPSPMTMKQTDCLTPDQAVDFIALIREQMNGNESCSFSEPLVRGKTVSWETDCDEGLSHSEVTFTADGFIGKVMTTVAGQEIPSTMTGRRIAATCVPDPDDD